MTDHGKDGFLLSDSENPAVIRLGWGGAVTLAGHAAPSAASHARPGAAPV